MALDGPSPARYRAHQATNYRIGLLSDDIITDEIDIVREALKRLPDQAAFDRTFRLRRAMQLQLTNSILPEDEWTRYEEVSYLSDCDNKPGCALPVAAY